MIIRNIKKEDIRRCVEIYNYYIINSTATFEEQPLTEAQFAERVERISVDYPYLVAEEDGKVVGYAYLDKYNERSAYRFTADLSIYLDNSCVSHGVGSRLLAEIEKAAKERGIVNILALITEENAVSVAFHGKHGFEPVGKLEKVGFKMNKWLDVLFYQKKLNK